MPKLIGGIKFTGKLDEYSTYTRKDMPGQVFMRKKGGGSKKTLLKGKSCINNRREMGEFGGRSTAGQQVRRAFYTLKNVAGGNLTPRINSLMNFFQKQDTVSDWGQRNVFFSPHRHLLEGYQISERYNFDSIVKSRISAYIDREKCSAFITVPDLRQGFNFYYPWQASMFHFVAILGIVPDMRYDSPTYQPVHPLPKVSPFYVETAWQPATLPLTGSTLIIEPAKIPVLHESHSLQLSVGIECGKWITNSVVEPVKYAGCGKILLMA